MDLERVGTVGVLYLREPVPTMESPPSEGQPCPLQFYNFGQLDHRQHCPVYTSIIRHEVPEIAVDDINYLESEFMALQHSVQNRINLLESEMVVLDGWQVKRDSRKPSFTQPPARKLQKLDGDKPKKKHSKLTSSASVESQLGREPGQQDSALHKMKGDAPDRFWASVEPYCADVTTADIQMLEEGIKSSEKKEEIFRVPPLGQHYSRRWALEDLQEEQSESLRLGQMADPLSKTSEQQDKDSFDSLLKDGELVQEKKKVSQYGPLTERVIAAFVEDPVSAAKGVNMKSQVRKLNLPTELPQIQTFEERLKKELIDLGLLDAESADDYTDQQDKKEDEILAELEKKQAELASVMEYNREQREVLLSLAKEEMKKQQLRAQVKELDDEITDWMKKVNSYKQKRKSLGRKEKETIWKLLETRDNLLQQLDAIEN